SIRKNSRASRKSSTGGLRQFNDSEEDKPMAIDPKEINSIESSMVHDEDPGADPQGLGVYLTLKFLSKVILGAYGVMLIAMLALQIALRGGQEIPVSLS